MNKETFSEFVVKSLAPILRKYAFPTVTIKAKLPGRNFSQSNFEGMSFSGANFSGANFSDADLNTTDFSDADLKGANFSNANLNGTDFSGANLSKANLSKVDLSEANLIKANLNKAHLCGADLTKSQLLDTDLSETVLTGACIEDWHINSATSLNGVICEYVYLQKSQQKRRPHNRNFKPGEFTKLYQKLLETVDIVFFDGIEWKAFLLAFLKLKSESGSDEISIQSFENRNGAFLVRINVPPDADKAEIEKFVEEKYKLVVQAKDDHILSLIQENTELLGIVKIMADKETSKYYFHQSSIGNIVDTAQSGSRQQSINHQHNDALEQNRVFVELADEIHQRLTQLEREGFSLEAAQQEVANLLAPEAKNNPTFKNKLMKLGQFLGGTAASSVFGEGVIIGVKSVLGLLGIPVL